MVSSLEGNACWHLNFIQHRCYTLWLKNATSLSLVNFEHDRVMCIILFFLDNKVGVYTLLAIQKRCGLIGTSERMK